MGSVSPKFNSNDELNMVRSRLGHAITLLCPVQAYPIPYFR